MKNNAILILLLLPIVTAFVDTKDDSRDGKYLLVDLGDENVNSLKVSNGYLLVNDGDSGKKMLVQLNGRVKDEKSRGNEYKYKYKWIVIMLCMVLSQEREMQL